MLPVRAIFQGYYGNIRRRPDTHTAEFEIARPEEFSHQWMQAIGWDPPPPRPIQRTVVDIPVDHSGYLPTTLSGEIVEGAPLAKRGPGRPPKARDGEGAGA